MKQLNISRFVWLCCLALVLTGCKEEISSLFADEGDIKAGDPVMFTSYLPGTATSRGAETRSFDATPYKSVAQDYIFSIKMFEQGNNVALGSADYLPTKTVENETVTYAADGTLIVKTGSDPLYWPGNAKKYGFEATAGTTTLEVDQTTQEKLLLQDRLLGYACDPSTDSNDALNYRTSKEWKAVNETHGLSTVEQYKKIPLYLKHQRSLVTVILKAGEGVNREDLAFNRALSNIHTVVYCYGASVQNNTIYPLPNKTKVNYTSSDFGPVESGVETTEYTAVVEPHDYLSGATSDVIAEIRLSGQRFTFYASNDFLYASYQDAGASDHETAVTHMNGYNLTAGKHLVIIATLGRGSRKILITSYVEDWTETVTTSIVDDYGQAGDPIQINSRQELYDFLNDPTRNKPGNVAIIVPNSLNLEQTTTTTTENEVTTTTTTDTPWATPMPLNCTLNMAGATFRTDHQVFSTIGASGNLVNGTISVGNASVESAVAANNLGTIQRVSVVPKDVNGNNSTGSATRAGLVVTNSGTISECISELPVQGTATTGEVFVGGIAASSNYSEDNGNTMPVIDGCTVNARVDGGAGNRGGGIVGEAVGRVTNNTFSYGITISQDATNFKNIIQAKTSDRDLRAYGNAWPTVAVNNVVSSTNINLTAAEDQYTAVIDRQSELALLISETYNKDSYKFRISNDFSVTKTGDNPWPYGGKTVVFNGTGSGNIYFKLDGNNKTITTDAMLFSTIQNNISDLTIRLSADMIASPDGGTDVMAPLAYAVMAGATISNVQVKGGDYRIQAATVGGLVVWACGGATIENCQCKAILQTWVGGNVSDEAKIYSGGIVANAANATITRCVFHNTEGTLFRNTATAYNDPVVEETLTQSGSSSSGIFYGGILGGTAPNSFSGTQENPSVTITDCTSWFSTSNNPQKGAIVGYAEYRDGNNLANGIADGCQGNWWNISSDGIGTYKSGMTIEQLLGKRNAVAPTQDANF